ncbi:larval cuticle protein 65Ag1-like [Nilaparvata lugens]|uniref:larval cuticle protein 65Ag1-like n=1 Tax=Nilaparvata lugens TaxID=108931 RepID=UPI00193DAAA7|nr:larval cuticle protein 65Ag1-like [Nilaparvata lugens]
MQSATFVFLAVVLVVAAQAAPQLQVRPPVPVIARSEVQDEAGQFSLTYTTADGTQVTKQGVLKPNADGTDNVLVEYGSYRYTSPEGQIVQVEYTADADGFHPKSPSIPIAPVAAPAVFV